MNTIDGIIEDLELEDSCVGGCTTKGEIIACLENLEILQKEKETVLQALEDVRAEIHEAGILDHYSDEIEVALVYGKVETIIEQKIAEMKGDKA